MRTQRPERRSLPTLWVDNREYDEFDRLARDHGLSIECLLMDLIRQGRIVLGDGTAKVVVLEVPQCTYDAFEKWTKGGDEEGINAMSRFLAHQGECIEEMMAATGK